MINSRSTWRNSKVMSCAGCPPPLPSRDARPEIVAVSDAASGDLTPRCSAIFAASSPAMLRRSPSAGTDRRTSRAWVIEPAPVVSGIWTILQRNAAEQPACGAAVGVNLRPQRIDVRERAFVAQTLQERQPQALIVEIAGVVEDVDFDDRAVDVAEGRPGPDVGHRGVHDIVDGDGGGINARRGRQLVVGLQVRGRKSQFPS